jgi:hypothetical protein
VLRAERFGACRFALFGVAVWYTGRRLGRVLAAGRGAILPIYAGPSAWWGSAGEDASQHRPL